MQNLATFEQFIESFSGKNKAEHIRAPAVFMPLNTSSQGYLFVSLRNTQTSETNPTQKK